LQPLIDVGVACRDLRKAPCLTAIGHIYFATAVATTQKTGEEQAPLDDIRGHTRSLVRDLARLMPDRQIVRRWQRLKLHAWS